MMLKAVNFIFQVKILKQRIAILEEEAASFKGSLPLQSQSSGASETSL